GVCGDPKLALIAKEAGYDYFEWSVGNYLRPRENEAAFEAALEQVRTAGLPCPAVNVFIPGDLKITGPDANLEKLEAFASTALLRAETAGVETIVFGSGGARHIPDGFNREKAFEQLVTFGKMLGPMAAEHKVTIAVEPLNLAECNILNTVGETALLVREVDHPNLRLLVDGYHWAKDNDTLSSVLENASLIVHAHVATVKGRMPPNPADPCSPFFSALCQAGYSGRVSIEGVIADPLEELPQALEIMRREST
ncbi:MAG: sugar phosphate isomerase/epimerase, partial [Anaerolineaceae bacterium]|nr:sugar phosphate isomerase/epimerase [Anaerolineaceae bacterium]